MPLTPQEIEHIAKLARLDLTKDQKKRFRVQLEAILDYIEKLQDLDTEDIAPTTSILGGRRPLREDEPQSSLSKEDLFKNAPKHDDGQFKIPPVFES
ncbi:MAG: Asp-tRNA(Asn)/Glu-tRNA(Gln) amidotransferase subunit GatC [Anaerolineae bacterium]|nr:Asp-tRNA(Asn)/Glu-tRNA(Gln) amidotransferase subunit GatC [Anaerolineae bacterium]MDK1079885.1 Asp-tRNA(Asn)/Glu-tRNA(Gln) amidotransferase subunit GatC [Anaerolineae bacterium]MDK1118186.1 Asp-tRNA(Asn)/Glu-tRNA(Gln) amidotransferase subunit GatC [Anaerolineae bacterium]